MRDDGAVSALCYKRLRPIDLSKASYVLWQPEAVTCRKCLAQMPAAASPNATELADKVL